jgi:glycosyltransferase involved in cell wall biosynthesis
MSASHQEFAFERTADAGPRTRPSEQARVSLIVATCGRVAELDRLLTSLDAQSYKNFEVVVVDQNPDDRLVPVLQRHQSLAIRHLRSDIGASRARNAGLRIAEGEIVAVPDDDCWYPDQLFAGIVQWFVEHPDFDGLSTAIRNEANQAMTPKFPPRPGPCTRKTILRCAMAANTFLRARATRAAGFFREDIGPGTASPYRSGEDLDYIIRSLERGLGIWYQPGLTVYHPDLRSEERLRRTAYSYAVGVGYVWRLHNYSWWWCLGEIVLRSVGGALFYLCKGNLPRSYVYLLRAAGELRGYAFRPSELPVRREIQPMTDDHA